jgi:hypothetical protein
MLHEQDRTCDKQRNVRRRYAEEGMHSLTMRFVMILKELQEDIDNRRLQTVLAISILEAAHLRDPMAFSGPTGTSAELPAPASTLHIHPSPEYQILNHSNSPHY